MKKTGRYDTSGMIEDQYEEGSQGQVLKNIPGIKSLQQIENLETKELLRANDLLIERYGSGHCFTANDICFMHKSWLGSLYAWAGSYRNVKISKGDFTFANPEFIPKLMHDLETAEFYALIVKQLREKGKPIPTNDIWIAASAMRHSLALISHDRHFEAIKGLLLTKE